MTVAVACPGPAAVDFVYASIMGAMTRRGEMRVWQGAPSGWPGGGRNKPQARAEPPT